MEIAERLQPDKSHGPDGINPKLLKECAESVAVPLAEIFQRSFDEGQLSTDWKLADVIQSFKKGSKLDPNNYRPVSLSPFRVKLWKASLEIIYRVSCIARIS